MTAALHAHALDVLRSWAAPSSQQSVLRDEYVAFLEDHPQGHLKPSDAGHLTASSLIVDPSAGRVLLTLHPKVSRWLQTGGHIEATDATLMAAALREAVEESGITTLTLSPEPVRLDRHLVPCRPGVMLYHFDVQYVAIAPEGAIETMSAESLDLEWFDWDTLPETDDSVRALVADARALVAR